MSVKNTSTPVVRYWAVVPAAGVGRRMGERLPKQYLPLGGRAVIAHTLMRLATHPAIAGIVVAIAADDPHWPAHCPETPVPVYTAQGGAERCHSVLNALVALADHADERDWVLVHDAARPCLRHDDIDTLLAQLVLDPVGGLLGLPVSDTVKRCERDGRVLQTVEREGLWRALTPQMFRLGALRKALESALAQGRLVTDEAAAIEAQGLQPRMVAGHADNIKITHPQDLALAELYLRQQEEACV